MRGNGQNRIRRGGEIGKQKSLQESHDRWTVNSSGRSEHVFQYQFYFTHKDVKKVVLISRLERSIIVR